MPVTVKGLLKLISSFRRIPKELDKEKKRILKQGGIDVQRSARADHRYNNPPHLISKGRRYSPSGNLDRSITYRTRGKSDNIAVRIYINPNLVTTEDGYNYGVIQHDGMGWGYKASPFSPKTTITGRNNLEHDWFLYRAFQKEKPKIDSNLKKAPQVAFRKARL